MRPGIPPANSTSRYALCACPAHSNSRRIAARAPSTPYPNTNVPGMSDSLSAQTLVRPFSVAISSSVTLSP